MAPPVPNPPGADPDTGTPARVLAHAPGPEAAHPAFRPALWPWEWLPDRQAIAHPQGCATCDAYLDHLELEQHLEIKSLQFAEEERRKHFARGEYTLGYKRGQVESQADGAALRSFDNAREVARLRATVRLLEGKCDKLETSLNTLSTASGVKIPVEEGYRTLSEDDDDDDEVEMAGSRRRRNKGKAAAVKPTTAQAKDAMQVYFDRRASRWETHQVDLKRLREIALASRESAVRIDAEGDVLMRSPTLLSRSLQASMHRPTALPAALGATRTVPDAPPRDLPGPPQRAPSPARPMRSRRSRASSPPRAPPPAPVVPARRARSPSPDRREYERSGGRHRSRSRSRSRDTRHRSHHESRPPARRRRSCSLSYDSDHVRGEVRYTPTPEQFRPPPAPIGHYYPPPVAMAQGGRGVPLYSDPYAYMPRFEQSAVYPPPLPYHTPQPPTSLPTQQTHNAWGNTRAEPAHAGRPFLGVPPHYSAADAPPLPSNAADLRHLMDVASQRTTAGLIAAAKLRYWMKDRQGSRSDNEVDAALRQYRIPQWFREEYEPARVSRARERARLREVGAVISRPTPDGSFAEWSRYLNEGPEPNVLNRHVRRNAETNQVEEDDLRGYLTASRLAFVITPGIVRDEKRPMRQEVFRLLAQVFQSRAHYEAELARTNLAVHPTLNLAAYSGPLPPTLDDVIRHAADRGVAPAMIHPELAAWAARYANSTLPAPAPVTPTEEEEPVAGGSGAQASDGDETPSTTPTGPAPTSGDVDVVMQE
ncbi:hypothetical protein TRAPUB_4369 [Trametes pubescens]|uniref:Uncharacterized protein n=1 Tax=Trametes pubescens TaxID=154538 RepID=A0A1M2VBE3_TRAPU|nr:hypothetical protein TRAPUB_4369 [Trametes pubescens]